MNKKYQVFVSSTYEDLKVERQKVIDAILQLDQFPVGMEMFSAADAEQWEIIQETIDSSDYYVLIIGLKYGSLIEDGPDAGISYTEKEFNYARTKGIPVLAFIRSDDAPMTLKQFDEDATKIAKLQQFKAKVKTGRTVKFWSDIGGLVSAVSQSLSKAMLRGDRPGWVRTTEFDLEKSHAEILRLTERVHMLEKLNSDLMQETNRKPKLWVEVQYDVSENGELHNENLEIADNTIRMNVVPVRMSDAQDGIDYRNSIGELIHVPQNEVRLFRHVCKNAFPLLFHMHNDGDLKATGVRIKMSFPNELLVLAGSELQEYITPDAIKFNKKAYEGWDARFFAPEDAVAEDGLGKFIGIDELIVVSDIAELLDPVEFNEVVSIFPSEVRFEDEEILHKGYKWMRGVYVLPTVAGEYSIKCEILCNEYPESVLQEIKVIVE